MKNFLLISLSVFSFGFLSGQEYAAYKVYNSKGKEINFKKVIREASTADVIFFGELHNDPIAHWLQLRLLRDISEVSKIKIIAGAEMFESDNQLVLDEYLAGKFDDKRFEEDARLWKNYYTDYKPLLLLAKEKGIPFVATNIPRRYASMVSRGGFEVLDSLSDEAKKLIAPLPVPYDPDLPAYKKMMEMTMGHGRPSENFPKAQAIKDATMAHFILMNMEEGHPFVHFNGAYHSDFNDGIIWYLNQYRKGLNIKTITTVLQKNIDEIEEENSGKADFIIVVPEDMTRTY